MKTRIFVACLIVSILANAFAIPYLTWKRFEVDAMYQQNVKEVAELAYAVGYIQAKGGDLKSELESYPTRLGIKGIESKKTLSGSRTSIEMHVLTWQAKDEDLVLKFGDSWLCSASLSRGR